MIVDNVITVAKYFPEFNASITTGIAIFCRMVGFAYVAPIFSRKEIPTLIKVPFCFLMTIILFGCLHPGAVPVGTSMILICVLNMVAGFVIGFAAIAIFSAIAAGGDMINMQMGLSSAVMFDQSTKSQSSILGTFFGLFGLVIFINIGGFYWLFDALIRSFEIFPMYGHSIPISQLVNMDYLISITSGVLFFGLQIAAPVLLATLGQDIILGIISKTAPQVNVFSLSFLFKPVLGVAILITVLPSLVNVVTDYFISFASIY